MCTTHAKGESIFKPSTFSQSSTRHHSTDTAGGREDLLEDPPGPPPAPVPEGPGVGDALGGPLPPVPEAAAGLGNIMLDIDIPFV